MGGGATEGARPSLRASMCPEAWLVDAARRPDERGASSGNAAAALSCPEDTAVTWGLVRGSFASDNESS